VWVEGGTFMMGSEEGDPDELPVHRVTVSGFWMQEHEVTNEEYARFDAEHEFPSGEAKHPVVRVTWQEAMDYAESVGGSLPTEAQWEFAARGQEGRKYPWGDGEPTCERARYTNCGQRTTIPVMSLPDGATPEGIHDLAGNVWEWVADWYGDYDAAEATDPRGPASRTSRVLRGGSFLVIQIVLRGANRFGEDPVLANAVGFRVVWALAGGQEN